jgi:hypothetical protein
VAKKMSRSQVASLGGLAVAEKTDMALLGSHGGAATVERYGKSHMKKLALRKHGYSVVLKTDADPLQADMDACSACTKAQACDRHYLARKFS